MMAHFRVEQRLSEKRRLSGSGPRFDWVVVDRLKPQDVKTFSTRKEARSAANELNSRASGTDGRLIQPLGRGEMPRRGSPSAT
jgi:hypothetical protein